MANIYVTAVYGSASLGHLPAQVGMVTNFGTIVTISGALVQVGSGANETKTWVYDHQLQLLSGSAGRTRYDFPSGSLCVPYDRHTRFPNGFVANKNAITGVVLWDGIDGLTATRLQS